jgi:hypothetical protein
MATRLMQKVGVLELLMNSLPEQLRHCRVAVCVLVKHLERTLTRTVRKLMEIKYESIKLRRQANTAQAGNTPRLITEDEEKREVDGFLGYAISEIREHWRKIHTKKLHEDDDDAFLSSVVEYLDTMRCFHVDVVLDDEYMELCYSISHQMVNKGGLTLVSKDYFQFGKSLMAEIRRSFSCETAQSNDRMKKAYDALVANKELREQFVAVGHQRSSVGREVKLDIYKELVTKAFNARVAVEVNKMEQKRTARHVEGTADTSFRTMLKVQTKKVTEKRR